MNELINLTATTRPVASTEQVSPKDKPVAGNASKIIAQHTISSYWLDDAINESKTDSWHSIRREIILSLTFLEAYIYEFVQSLKTTDPGYFLKQERVEHGKRTERAFNEPDLLLPCISHCITDILDIPLDYSQWDYLLELHQGLLHFRHMHEGSDSSEDTLSRSGSDKLLEQQLQLIPNGWATSVALEVVTRIHKATGYAIPEFILKAKYSLLLS